MVTVPNSFKDAYNAQTRDVYFGMFLLGVVGGSSVQYSLDGNDLIDATVDYPFSVNDMPVIGQVFSSTFRVKIKSDNIPYTFWTNATDISLAPYLEARPDPDDSTTWSLCQLGVFYVTSRKSTDNFATYELEATDGANRLDVPLPSTWDNNAMSRSYFGIRFYYADTVVSNILSAVGLSLDPNYVFPTDSQGNRMEMLSLDPIENRTVPESITARQALGYIGGLFGANCMMNRFGQFTFKTWTAATGFRDQIPLSNQWMGGLSRDREDTQYQFIGFYHTGDGIVNPTGITPDDDNGAVYLHSDALLHDVTGLWTEATDTFVYYSNQFATDFSGQYFVGGEMQYRGKPWLECGDVVTVQYEFNGITQIAEYCIMNHTLNISGGLRGTMRCYTPTVAEVEGNESASGTFNNAASSAVNLGKSHPVGSVFVTDTNQNPADILNFGSWTLIDREFKSQSRTATVTRNTTNFSALSVTALYDGHSITFVGTMTSSVSISNTNFEVLTQTLTNNGVSALPTSIPFIGYSDGAHAAVLMDIDTAGRVRTMDVVVRGTATSIASGSSITWSVTCPCVYTAMQDSFCDKFYWQRTA